MLIELTDREVEVIVKGLRGQEKHSRIGFMHWMARSVGSVDRKVIDEKTSSAEKAYAELIALRARFGDTAPVSVD